MEGHCHGVDSGSPFHSARNDGGVECGWYPVSVNAFPRPSNPPTVIPAKAGIHYVGMDSGSPFHSARNDRGVEWLVSGFCQCISTSVESTHRHSRESGNPQYLGVDSGSPFHSARNDGLVEWLVSGFCQCISTPVEPTYRHSRESGNPVPRRGFRFSASLRPE